MDFLKWLAARMQEPSTYAGLSSMMGALHLSTAPGLVNGIIAMLTGVGGVLAFVISEKKA